MNKKGRINRTIMLMATLAMIMLTVFTTEIPANAATSISELTVETDVRASSNNAISIKWNRVSGAQGYVICRRESVRKPFKKLKMVKATTISYTDRKLTAGKAYQYAVRAYRKEDGKTVYSKYEAVIAATRPTTVSTTIKAKSGPAVTVSWKKNTRADGYRIYRRIVGKSWEYVTDVSRAYTSYTDTGVSGSSKYVYTVRPYKRGGDVKYMGAIKLSNQVTTPKATTVSNSKFTSYQKDVMKKILYAVETGGQIYGNQDYGSFTEAYTNSGIEHAITIGAGQWYATEAQRLLKLIHTVSPETYEKYDAQGYVWNEVCNKDWKTYRIPKSSGRAKIIINILKSDAGIKCQDQLMYEQIESFETEIRNLGVTDIQAVGMFINIRHQGGYSAVTRVLAKTAKPYNLINVYKALASDSGNQVGTYKTRQAKVYSWLNTYMK